MTSFTGCCDNINPFVSVFLALAIVLAIGAGIFHIGIFPITKKPNWEINAVILTLGIGICLQNIALFTFGERYKGMPHFFKGNIKFWGVVIGGDRLMVLFIGLVLILGLLYFVKKTTTGLSIQAVSRIKILLS